MSPKKKQISIDSKSILFTLALLLFLTTVSAAASQIAEPNPAAVRKRPVETFQLISFALNNGQRVNGRIVTKGPVGFEISVIEQSKIKLMQYYRDDIVQKTIIYSKRSALDYWRETGNYFLEKVGDFKDDPDEFIQAIRCFEKAKAVVSDAMGPGHKLVAELDKKINQTKTEMNNWLELIKPRAKMRELEALSTIDQRFEDVQSKLDTNEKQISSAQIKLASLTATAAGYDKIRDRLSSVEALTNSFQQRIARTEDDVYDLWRYYRNRNVYYSSPVIKNNDSRDNQQ